MRPSISYRKICRYAASLNGRLQSDYLDRARGDIVRILEMKHGIGRVRRHQHVIYRTLAGIEKAEGVR